MTNKRTIRNKSEKENSFRFNEDEIMKYAYLLCASCATKEEAQEILKRGNKIEEAALFKGYKDKTLQDDLTPEQIKKLEEDSKEILEDDNLKEYCRVLNSSGSLILLIGLRVTTFEKHFFRLCYMLEGDMYNREEAEINKTWEDKIYNDLKQAMINIKSLLLSLANLAIKPYYLFFTRRTYTSSFLRFYEIKDFYQGPVELYNFSKFEELSLEDTKVSKEKLKEDIFFVSNLLRY